MTERAVDAPLARAVVGRSEGQRRRDRATTEKRLAAAASIAMLAAVLRPVLENWRRPQRDGFPLSFYPMFSAKRSRRHRVTHLVGVDAAGRRVPIPYTHAGAGGLNQVRRQITRAVALSRAAELCASVAAGVARGRPSRHADVVTVQIVTGTYDLRGYFAGAQAPLSEVVHASASCPSREEGP